MTDKQAPGSPGSDGPQPGAVPSPVGDRELLKKLIHTRMPFGKYKGRLLIDLPEPYVVWFARKGFPSGQLGEMMQTLYEIKVNGLEYLFRR